MTTLVHYTCEDHIEKILDMETVVPRFQPALGYRRLSWWTDITWPTSPESLGLTGHSLSCDRMRYRVVAADTSMIVPWTEWARDIPAVTRGLLETPGTLPARWFVAEVDVLIGMVT